MPLALAFLMSCAVPAASETSDPPDAIATAADTAFRPLLKQYDVPGIAVAVTIEGRQYFLNYGVTAKASGRPVTKETLFEIGSISKTFTATLFGYAEALGKITLDDHPGTYMPQLRGSALDAATLLHLGTYTAGGLPLQFSQPIRNNADMANFFRQWQPSAAPGAQRRYSNPSLGLFGHLTALALHADFTDLMQTEIFPKLGLRHTYIRVPQPQMDNYAWGHGKANAPIRANPGVLAAETYGVKTTTADLIRYVEVNIRPDSVDEPLRRAVERTHVGYFQVGGMVQGLGWEQYAYPVTLDELLAGNSTAVIMEPQPAVRLTPPRTPSQPTLFNKTGSTNGFGAYVAFVPAKKIGIVILANKNLPIPARITAAHAVLERLAAEAR